MLFPLHRVKDNKEVLVNSDFVIYVEQFPEYLEVVVLSDECLQVKETMNQFVDLMNGKRIENHYEKNIVQDAISKDICKKNPQKKYRSYRKRNNKIMKRHFDGNSMTAH